MVVVTVHNLKIVDRVLKWLIFTFIWEELVSNRRGYLGQRCFWGCSDAPAAGAHSPVKLLVEHFLLLFSSCLLLGSTGAQKSEALP